jgi:hypothetical protein
MMEHNCGKLLIRLNSQNPSRGNVGEVEACFWSLLGFWPVSFLYLQGFYLTRLYFMTRLSFGAVYRTFLHLMPWIELSYQDPNYREDIVERVERRKMEMNS